MGDWTLYSVAETVLDLIENVPPSISGTRLLQMADRQRERVQTFTGATIGSNSIPIKYQEAILQFTMANTASTMMSLGTDASDVTLGDFKVSKGSSSNLDTIYKNSTNLAMQELKSIGKRITTFKANG